MLDISAFPLWAICFAFAAGALLVGVTGARLPAVAAAIGQKTGIGQAFAGMLLLGGITTLPELATTTSAAAFGAGNLALNNVFGSVSFNLLLLVLADIAVGGHALTSIIGKPATLLQGVLGMLLLAGAGAAVVAGDVSFGPVGLASALLFTACVAAMWIASQYESRPTWQIVDPPPRSEADKELRSDRTRRELLVSLLALGGLILIGGVLLSQTGEAIAERTGVGEGLVGLSLLAFATSLTELTTMVSAARGGHYELAVGDAFGANLFNIAMIFLIDVASPGPPVLSSAGPFEAFAAMLALTLTAIFLVGLVERGNRTVWRLGYDSVAAVVTYCGGIVVLASVLR